MGFRFSRRLGCVAIILGSAALAACQGNIGGGSGLSIPQAPGYGQPAGPGGGGGQTQSRERVLDGAVFLSSKLTEVPLPQLAGFAVTISLGTPGPATAAEPATAAPSKSHTAADGLRANLSKLAAHASPSPSASASAAAAASPAASGSAAAVSSASPSALASGVSPEPSASVATPSPKPTHTASPSSGPSEPPHIETKTTIYPDDAPPPPTPVPTGEVQTFVHRAPIIRGYVLLGSDISLYGLGAVRFTLPATELTPKRGFTIALYESGKHRHDRLMSYDTEPVVGDGVVNSGKTDPIELKKAHGYLLMIYGDDEAAPAPNTSVPPGYPAPGNNPFPAGSGVPQPSYTQIPGNPYATPTPYNPYATPTPYNPYATATPTSPFGTPHP